MAYCCTERDFKSNNWMYSCKYHIVFCPKYRRKVLTSPIEERLKEIITGVAQETRSTILEMEIMPDHVQSCAKSTRSMVSLLLSVW